MPRERKYADHQLERGDQAAYERDLERKRERRQRNTSKDERAQARHREDVLEQYLDLLDID